MEGKGETEILATREKGTYSERDRREREYHRRSDEKYCLDGRHFTGPGGGDRSQLSALTLVLWLGFQSVSVEGFSIRGELGEAVKILL